MYSFRSIPRYPLRLVLASPIRPRSVIIARKMVRSGGAVDRRRSRSSLRFCRCFLLLAPALPPPSPWRSPALWRERRERRRAVTTWSKGATVFVVTSVEHSSVYVGVQVCGRPRRDRKGLVAKVGKRFIRPRELPNYTRPH